MPQNSWIPVYPSSFVQTSDVLQATIEISDLVVWRSESGQLQIWQNRCPHRSIRLSLGHVNHENLVCAYHGWQFSVKNGICQKIPSQPLQRAPTSICTKTYPVRETQAMIWVNLNEQYQPNENIESNIKEKHDTYFLGSVVMDHSIHKVLDALVDEGFEQTDRWQFKHSHQAWNDVSLFISPQQQSCSLYLISYEAKPDSHFYINTLRKLRDHVLEIESC